MSLEENFGKVRKRTKKKQTSEADILEFQVGFFEILEEDKRRMEEDELDEDNSTRELSLFNWLSLTGRSVITSWLKLEFVKWGG